jgi:uncharacterized membrane protein YtjA (UPF0391 family)
MLGYTIVFFIIAGLAALFGLGDVTAAAAYVSQTVFVVFLVLSGLALLSHLIEARQGSQFEPEAAHDDGRERWRHAAMPAAEVQRFNLRRVGGGARQFGRRS